MRDDCEALLLESSPTAILVLNRDGTVEEMNQAARKMFAFAEKDVVGHPILSMVVPEDRDRIRDLFLRVLQGQRREWTTRFRRGDSHTRAQWVRAVPDVRAARVERMVVFTRDITETRDGRPETLQLQALLENLPGQFSLVVDGAGLIRHACGLGRTHFRSDVDVLGSPLQELVAPPAEEFGASVPEILESVARGEDWAGLQWHCRADESVFPVRLFASPHRHPTDGRVLGALLAGRDVGAEFDWRERAKRAQRLAAVGELVTRIAADIEEVLDDVPRDPLRQSGVADRLGRARGYLAKLRAFGDVGEARRRAVTPAGVVRSALSTLGTHVARLGVEVHVDETSEPRTVLGDERHLVLAVAALLENALDSLEGSGGGKLYVSYGSTPTDVSIHVTDTGVSTDAESLHRAFEPFFTTRDGRAGLGLTLARAVISEHDGRIWSDIDSSGRTVFSIQLPVDGEARLTPFHPSPLTLAKSRSVLVVDDDEDVRVGIRRFLEKVGFEVREAWSGRSALAQITAGHFPDAVLSDFRMSDGAGDWLLAELSRDFPDLLRRTIIVTGAPDHGDVKALKAKTGCPVLGKPLHFPTLLEVIDEAVLREHL